MAQFIYRYVSQNCSQTYELFTVIVKLLVLLWSPYVIGQTIIFLPCDFYLLLSFFLSSPILSHRRLDVCHTSTHGVACGLSANLECRSESCCTRLTGNTGRKNVAKNRHLGTIAPLCRAISSQLRHISTIGKNLLSSNISFTCPRIWWASAH